MATEQYSIGYEEGFQDGWNAAVDSLSAQQEPVAWIGQSEHLLSWDKFYDDMTPLYTSPPAQRKPLTDEQIEIGRRAPWGEVLDPFTAGVRFAETRHDITKGGAA